MKRDAPLQTGRRVTEHRYRLTPNGFWRQQL
jgi:hypothetical protein